MGLQIFTTKDYDVLSSLMLCLVPNVSMLAKSLQQVLSYASITVATTSLKLMMDKLGLIHDKSINLN
jgi:hypothetical protein